jgi:hypothetical protein
MLTRFANPVHQLVCYGLWLALALVVFVGLAIPQVAARMPSIKHFTKISNLVRNNLPYAINSAQDGLHLPIDISAQAPVQINFKRLTGLQLHELQAKGFNIDHYNLTFGQVIGDGNLKTLAFIAQMPEVATIRPNFQPRLNAGISENQALQVLGVDVLRAKYNLTGQGVTVGILSDSFHLTPAVGGNLTGKGCARILTESMPQLSGDLPSEVYIIEDAPLSIVPTDEGAAMAELFHDLAPGSRILFHTGSRSRSDFAEGIDELVACGAQIVMDDLIYLTEPMFQDGWIAQAAIRAVQNGAYYIAPAGNAADLGVDTRFKDINPQQNDTAIFPTGADFHDFGQDQPYTALQLPGRCSITAVMQWNDPYDGTLGPGASSDLDLYLATEPSTDSLFSGSADPQGCAFSDRSQGGDPVEIVSHTNPSNSQQTVYLAVDHFCGPKDKHLRIVLFTDNCKGIAVDQNVFNQMTIIAHPLADEVITVGAVHYREIETLGNHRVPLAGIVESEPFSSLGGLATIYFDGQGQPIPGGPLLRQKPNISAPDGTNTSFFGNDINADADLFPNFFGTSAAVPHVAAIAALLLETEPQLPPYKGYQRLFDMALDIADPGGWDAYTGAGLLYPDATITKSLNTEAEILVIDVNGDGLDDVAVGQSLNPRKRRWLVEVARADGRRTPQGWGANSGGNSPFYLSTDVNGDGTTDIIWAQSTGEGLLSWQVATSTGNQFDDERQWSPGFGRPEDLFFAGDFNGDGLGDIAAARINAPSIVGWQISTSNASAFSAATNWSDDFGNSTDQFYAGDFNGDGFTDLAAAQALDALTVRWLVATSSGSKLLDAGAWADDIGNLGDRFFVGDFDGDRLDDLVFARSAADNSLQWHVARSDGLGFKYDGVWLAAFGSIQDRLVVGDFNGDGATDLAAGQMTALGTIEWHIAPSKRNRFDDGVPWSANPAE